MMGVKEIRSILINKLIIVFMLMVDHVMVVVVEEVVNWMRDDCIIVVMC